MNRKLTRHLIFSLLVTSFLVVSLNAYAGTISGGVDDADIIDRHYRDGASGIHFIDVDSQISGDGIITSWSIWAQSYMPWAPDPTNTDQRQVGLLIFRNNGSGWTVVGKSPLATIPSGASAWDRKYTFSASIWVKQGDRLGFFYPFQGSDINDPNPTIPGGVIAFTLAEVGGGHNVRYHVPWGSAQPTELNVGDSVPYDWFQGGPEGEGDRGRIYSLNVHGVTNMTIVPNALLLLE